MGSVRPRTQYGPSAIDTNVMKTPRPVPALNKAKTRSMPLKARVQVVPHTGSRVKSPEPISAKEHLSHRNHYYSTNNPTSTEQRRPQPTRLRSVASYSSLQRNVPVTSLSPPTHAHAKPTMRMANATTRRSAQELQAKVSPTMRSAWIEPDVPASDTIKTQASPLLPSAKIPMPSSRPSNSAQSNIDKPLRPVRVYSGQRSATTTLVSPTSSAIHVSSLESMSSFPNPNEHEAEMKFRSEFEPPFFIGRHSSLATSPSNVYSAKPAHGQERTRMNLDVSSAPVLTSLRARTAQPNIPITASDTSGSWSEHMMQSLPVSSSSPPIQDNASFLQSPQCSIPGDDIMESSEVLDAKQARKLLDLEISNKSLLAINTALESSKVKLTKELRELRQSMVFQNLPIEPDSKNMTQEPIPFVTDPQQSTSMSDKPRVGSQVLQLFMRQDQELEEIHERCRSKIDDLLNQARTAIFSQPDVGDVPLGVKVLHPSELKYTPDTSANESYISSNSDDDIPR